jgi:hypothetical protein
MGDKWCINTAFKSKYKQNENICKFWKSKNLIIQLKKVAIMMIATQLNEKDIS